MVGQVVHALLLRLKRVHLVHVCGRSRDEDRVSEVLVVRFDSSCVLVFTVAPLGDGSVGVAVNGQKVRVGMCRLNENAQALQRASDKSLGALITNRVDANEERHAAHEDDVVDETVETIGESMRDVPLTIESKGRLVGTPEWAYSTCRCLRRECRPCSP